LPVIFGNKLREGVFQEISWGLIFLVEENAWEVFKKMTEHVN